MLNVEDAQKQILSGITPLAEETVPLREALGRILAAPIVSPIDLPPFDNSAMDGYAVAAQDLRNSTAATPAALRLIGRIAAGEVFQNRVLPGTCVRLFTGSPLPEGADAVIMQEDTRSDPADPAKILCLDTVKSWENIRLKGEDVKCGTALVAGGERLTASRVGLLAAIGVTGVSVGRKPVVGLMATGSELVEPGQKLGPGQIYESNRVGLSALVSQAGGQARILPLVNDTMESTCATLAQAFNECDVVVSTGGVSVGEFDLVKAAFEKLGGKLAFWKVAMKPGKPFVFGKWREKFLFGLPGNPVSAFVTFLILVRPALLRFQRATAVHLSSHPGLLADALANRGDRRHFVRVKVEHDGSVRLAGIQASHILSSLAGANGLVDIPPATEWPAGQSVSVLRWEQD
ncbi:MAG: molybdopterin molybdotransferase MoeA [Verrucomicrobia bacterium]|nr:molybdopterin molybdotransferase MoeA [Verrucomicrobiota bacterium]